MLEIAEQEVLVLGLWLDDLLNDPGPVSEVEEADIARVLGLQVLVGVREIPSSLTLLTLPDL